MVVVSPPAVKLPERYREVPVALEKPREVKLPEGPETVAPVKVGLVKVPFSLRELKRADLRSASVLDWRVTVGLVSARRISSLRIVGL